MIEIDALMYELREITRAFNNLHKDYVKLLKRQGEVERENKLLKQLFVDYAEVDEDDLEEELDKLKEEEKNDRI